MTPSIFGMDVHQATISAAVRDSAGNLVMEATLETKAETILEFVHGLRGSLHVSFEAGFGFDDAFHHYPAGSIPDGDRNTFLLHIDIFGAGHKGVPPLEQLSSALKP